MGFAARSLLLESSSDRTSRHMHCTLWHPVPERPALPRSFPACAHRRRYSRNLWPPGSARYSAGSDPENRRKSELPAGTCRRPGVLHTAPPGQSRRHRPPTARRPLRDSKMPVPESEGEDNREGWILAGLGPEIVAGGGGQCQQPAARQERPRARSWRDPNPQWVRVLHSGRRVTA